MSNYFFLESFMSHLILHFPHWPPMKIIVIYLLLHLKDSRTWANVISIDTCLKNIYEKIISTTACKWRSHWRLQTLITKFLHRFWYFLQRDGTSAWISWEVLSINYHADHTKASWIISHICVQSTIRAFNLDLNVGQTYTPRMLTEPIMS